MPVTRTLTFSTSIFTGDDGTEQRSMIHAGRASWVLSYNRLSLTERDTLLTAHSTAKGSFDQTLTLSFLGTTYTRVYFDSDELSFVEQEPTVYSGSVKLCQVLRAPDTGSLPANFPALANGCPTQRPYTHSRAFDNILVITEGGRYARYKRATPLRQWSAGGSVLGITDATAIWDFFRRARGRFRSFGFTDPDSGDSYTVRFASDTLDLRYVDAGHHSVNVTLQEIVV